MKTARFPEKKDQKRIETVFEVGARILLALFLIAGGYGIFRYFSAPIAASLQPITTPPQFSVDYIYNFSSITILSGNSMFPPVDQDMQDIKNAGFGGVKVGFYFRQSNTIAEQVVTTASKNGLYPLGILQGHNVKPADRSFNQKELTEWEDFVRKEAKTFKNCVYFWEVWNEPNMTELRFRYGTPEEYLELLKRTYTIIKQENPQAQVIVNADMSDRESRAFTEGFLSLPSAPYYDILSLHPYGNKETAIQESVIHDRITAEEQVIQEYHLNKPLMISEIGQPDSQCGEEEQAERAEMVFRIAVEKKLPVVWFHYSDARVNLIDGKSGWGLKRLNGSAKPSYERLKTMMKK